MASRDEWFTIHTSGDGSLTKSAGPRQLSGGFQVDPEQIPAIRAAFQSAVEEMQEARAAMRDMRYTHGGTVNPVVDKYLAALAEVGYGDTGSAVMAADSATTEYQKVIDQLNLIVAGYANREEAVADRLGRLRS